MGRGLFICYVFLSKRTLRADLVSAYPLLNQLLPGKFLFDSPPSSNILTATLLSGL